MGALAWFRRHWKAILGGIFLIPPILRGLRFFLDFGGYIDFIVAHMTEPGWLGVVIADLVDPPSGIILPLIVLGLGLIYWDSRRFAVRVKGPTVSRERLSDLSNTLLRERASRFSAQLREFETEHALEERRIFQQEIEEMRRQLPVKNAEDIERRNTIAKQHRSAMMERRAGYQAVFNTRFRSLALEFREELCRREGVYPPYKPDIRYTAALEHGLLTGINPVSQVGDYLDELIRKLPD
jgi:hypothetical protein